MFRCGGNADTGGLPHTTLYRNIITLYILVLNKTVLIFTDRVIPGINVVVSHLSRGPFTVLSCLRPVSLLCSVDEFLFQGSAGAREQARGRRRRKHDLHDQLPRAAQGGQERHARIYRQKAVPGAGVREARLRQVSKAQYVPKPAPGNRSLARSLMLSAVSRVSRTSTPLFKAKAIYNKIMFKKTKTPLPSTNASIDVS